MFTPTQMQPGTKYPTHRSGTLAIVDYIDPVEVLVVFINTGYQKTTTLKHIVTGNVHDPVIGKPDMIVGTIHQTTRSGKIKILKFHNAAVVGIEFIDTGNTKTVTRHAILSGKVKDKNKGLTIEQVVARRKLEVCKEALDAAVKEEVEAREECNRLDRMAAAKDSVVQVDWLDEFIATCIEDDILSLKDIANLLPEDKKISLTRLGKVMKEINKYLAVSTHKGILWVLYDIDTYKAMRPAELLRTYLAQ